MADYFVKIRGFGLENPHNLFVGAFDSKSAAEQEVSRLQEMPDLEVVMGNGKPVTPKKAVHVEVTTKIAAKKEGLRSPVYGDTVDTPTLLGSETPDNILELVNTEPEVVEKPKSNRGRKPGIPNKPKATLETVAQTPLPAVEVPQIIEVVPAVQSPKLTKGNAAKTFEEVIQEFKAENGRDPEVIIVSKFPGTINWLRNRGINGHIVDRVRTASQIQNAIVVGVLPPRLAAFTYKHGTVDLPGLRVDQLGKPLSEQELEEAGAKVLWYTTREG